MVLWIVVQLCDQMWWGVLEKMHWECRTLQWLYLRFLRAFTKWINAIYVILSPSTIFHLSLSFIIYLNGLPHTVDMSHREAIRYYTSPFIETHVMQASFVAGFVPAVRGPRLNAGKRLLDVLMRHLLKIQKPALLHSWHWRSCDPSMLCTQPPEPMGARSELAVLVVSDGKVARCLAA